MLRLIPAVAFVLVTLPSLASAAKVKVWHHHAPSHYERAQLKGTVVTSEGAVRLSRALAPLAGVEAGHVWAVIEDRAGNLIAATGDNGKVYKVAPDGKASVLYTADDGQVLSLAAAPDGTIYAGTGPNGQIIRIDPQGVGRVLHRAAGNYVWSLAVSTNGQALYAGTGPRGTIYRVTPDGKVSAFYSTRQEHVLSLAAGPDGSLFAGTDKAGLVYRIDTAGKGFVLFSAPQAEVRALVATTDAVYAGTSSPGSRRRPGSGSGSASSSSYGSSPSSSHSSLSSGSAPDKVSVSTGSSSSGSSSESKSESKASPAPAPSAPSSGENSVWRIGLDGSIREVFRERAMVLSLLRTGGRLYVGTGMDGQLFEVDEATRERTEVARLDHGQVLGLCARKDGSVVLAAGDPGKLYVLRDGHVGRGTVTSDVLDARMLSKWGALRWQADAPAGTRVTVAVRSGNVAEPDDTWGPWSSEQEDGQNAVIAAPPARFLQYRVTLTSDDRSRTPALRDLTLRYKNNNQAPEVTSLEVPNLDAANQENAKRLRFKWSATDANEDEVSYDLYVRKNGWKDWVLLEDDLDKKEFEWDTTATPSGVYRLKLVASDRHDNAAEDALTHERISEPFVVSHEPPRVELKVASIEGGNAVLEATASDPLARLTSASYAVNGKKWVNVFPTDGLFDSKSEAFRFKAEALRPGTYVVVLRVRDAAGNVGSADVVFTVPGKGP